MVNNDFYANIPMGTSFEDFQAQAESQNIDLGWTMKSTQDGKIYTRVNLPVEVYFIFGQGRVSEEHFQSSWCEESWKAEESSDSEDTTTLKAELTPLMAEVDDNNDITRFLVEDMTKSIKVDEDGVTIRVIDDEFNSGVMFGHLCDSTTTFGVADARWLEQRKADWEIQLKGLIASSEKEPIPDHIYEVYKDAYWRFTLAGLVMSRVGTCDLYPPTKKVKEINSISELREALLKEHGSDEFIFLDVQDGYTPDWEFEYVSDPLKKTVYAIPYINECTLDLWCEKVGLDSNFIDGEDLKFRLGYSLEGVLTLSQAREIALRLVEEEDFAIFISMDSFVGKKLFMDAILRVVMESL